MFKLTLCPQWSYFNTGNRYQYRPMSGIAAGAWCCYLSSKALLVTLILLAFGKKRLKRNKKLLASRGHLQLLQNFIENKIKLRSKVIDCKRQHWLAKV